ncbi:MAG: sensor histidine kinase [Solirubrobacterales bacterium]
MRAWLQARLYRAGLDLAYLAIGGATAVLAFGVWVGAVTVTLSLLVFVVGLPLFLLSAIVFRWTTELDRRNAALALGAPLRGRYRDHRGEGFFERLGRTAGDSQTWKDLAWLVLHSLVGVVFAAVAVGLVAQTIAVALLPAWYWAIDGGVDVGIWHIDALGKALAATALAIPLAALAMALLRGMAIAESRLAAALLGSGPGSEPAVAEAATGEAPRRAPSRVDPRTLLLGQAALSGLVAIVVCVAWLATGAGYFWPGPVLIGLTILLGLDAGLQAALRGPERMRPLAIQGAISAVVTATVVAIWALTGAASFWPVWVILGLLVALALHLLVATMWRHVYPDARERRLEQRVDVLTRTRRGALDVQAAELTRIERDLHDGAQARLVSLSMQLGRAEERLADQPEAAELVRAARSDASAAIGELRDLARGIAPPILADRGLVAAIEGLGRRSPIPVVVEAELERRPPPVLETAAYFVVAEALTNVAKHAPQAGARVRIELDAEALRVEVGDDGPGGADPEGGGLRGLRQRVEALDGTLAVASAAGEGTTIRAVLPCEW